MDQLASAETTSKRSKNNTPCDAAKVFKDNFEEEEEELDAAAAKHDAFMRFLHEDEDEDDLLGDDEEEEEEGLESERLLAEMRKKLDEAHRAEKAALKKRNTLALPQEEAKAISIQVINLASGQCTRPFLFFFFLLMC